MAPSRRILFLPNGNWPSTNISTVNCSEWCSTGDCFNFCSPPFPPSPPSPPPIIVIPSPIPIEIIPKPPRHVPTIVIVIAAVLTTCFLLIYFSVLLSRRTSRRRRGLSTPPQPNNPDDDDDDDDGGEGETHHIWYIRTVGLDEPTIDSITICAYRGGEGLIEGTDCSVCLSDFRDGELVRLLPKCNHAFHIPCIDTWLNSHVNCPLCRAPILASSSVAPANPSPSSSVAVPIETSSINENSSVPPSENNGLGSVEGVESGIGVSGVGIVVGSECSPPIVVSGSKAQSNLEEDLSRSKIDDPVALDVAADAGLQPVRRSVSMDSSSMDSLLFRVQPGGSSGVGGEEPNFDEEVGTKNRVTLESCFKGGSLQKGPLEMERSLSSGGGLFFLSRYGRGRKSILPL